MELLLPVILLPVTTRVAEQIDYVETVLVLQTLLIAICVSIIIVTNVQIIKMAAVVELVTELLL
jgi:hypothetical protein